jgi:hypothetical protein
VAEVSVTTEALVGLDPVIRCVARMERIYGTSSTQEHLQLH